MPSVFGDLDITGVSGVNTDAADGAPGLTLGTRIIIAEAGTITALRWRFPDTLPSGTVIGVLYDYTGISEITRADFTAPVAGDWNEVALSTPVDVLAGDEFLATVWTPDRYVAAGDYFNGNSVVSGPLTAPADDPNDHNGVFNVGATPAYPTNNFNEACYFADLVFTAVATVTGTATLTASVSQAAAGRQVSTGAVSTLTASLTQAASAIGVAAAASAMTVTTTLATAAAPVATASASFTTAVAMTATPAGLNTQTGRAALTARIYAAGRPTNPPTSPPHAGSSGPRHVGRSLPR